LTQASILIDFSPISVDNSIMIGRRIQDDIVKNLRHFPAIGFVSPCQAGKTTLAKMIAEWIDCPVIYLDRENPNDFQKLNGAQLYPGSESSPIKNAVWTLLIHRLDRIFQ